MGLLGDGANTAAALRETAAREYARPEEETRDVSSCQRLSDELRFFRRSENLSEPAVEFLSTGNRNGSANPQRHLA